MNSVEELMDRVDMLRALIERLEERVGVLEERARNDRRLERLREVAR